MTKCFKFIKVFIYKKLLLRSMNYMRQLPNDYLDLCPVIDEKYKIVFKLGCGRFSKVKMAINLVTKQRVAIKIMNEKIDSSQYQRGYEQKVLEMFLNQISMTFEAKHRNIVQIIDFNIGGISRASDGKITRILYYVMKIQQYGELYRIINLTDQFTQKIARRIFSQLLSALCFIHNKKMAHCDIKSQNILLDDKFNIKIVDFGSARYHSNQKCEPILYNNTDNVGSIKCNAPELSNSIEKGVYRADNIDIFAVGCFLFELVMKAEPFKSSNINDQCYSNLIKNEKKKYWDIFSNKYVPSAQFKGIYRLTKDLIERMLAFNPQERISIQQIQKHPWLKGQTINRSQYKKEMSNRVKKVVVRVRKQHEAQIKHVYLKEKGKKQIYNFENFTINIKGQIQQKIIKLKNLILNSCNSQSSDNSSPSDNQLQTKPSKGKQKIEANEKQNFARSQRQ